MDFIRQHGSRSGCCRKGISSVVLLAAFDRRRPYVVSHSSVMNVPELAVGGLALVLTARGLMNESPTPVGEDLCRDEEPLAHWFVTVAGAAIAAFLIYEGLTTERQLSTYCRHSRTLPCAKPSQASAPASRSVDRRVAGEGRDRPSSLRRRHRTSRRRS